MDAQNKTLLVLFAKMFDIIGEIKRKKKKPINLLTGAFPKTSVKVLNQSLKFFWS
jgi:hypothetical protein